MDEKTYIAMPFANPQTTHQHVCLGCCMTAQLSAVVSMADHFSLGHIPDDKLATACNKTAQAVEGIAKASADTYGIDAKAQVATYMQVAYSVFSAGIDKALGDAHPVVKAVYAQQLFRQMQIATLTATFADAGMSDAQGDGYLALMRDIYDKPLPVEVVDDLMEDAQLNALRTVLATGSKADLVAFIEKQVKRHDIDDAKIEESTVDVGSGPGSPADFLSKILSDLGLAPLNTKPQVSKPVVDKLGGTGAEGVTLADGVGMISFPEGVTPSKWDVAEAIAAQINKDPSTKDKVTAKEIYEQLPDDMDLSPGNMATIKMTKRKPPSE